MTDKTAVIWTKYGGAPRKVATMTHTGAELRLTYDAAAPIGVSIIHDIRKLRGNTVTFPVNAALPIPPYLSALLPPPHGPLWTYAVERLRYLGCPPKLGEEYWDILLATGHNGIGHIDVFENDAIAEKWYGHRYSDQVIGEVVNRSGLWDLFRTISESSVTVEKIERMNNAFGPTPGVTGMIPKLLTTVNRRWLIEENDVTCLIKTEPEQYMGILAMEMLCYDVHALAGVKTPKRWLRYTPANSPLLITERFDRLNGTPLPVESFYSILRLASGGRIMERWTNAERITESPEQGTLAPGEIIPYLEHVAQIVRNPEIGLAPKQEREFFKRITLALMTGNSDLHLENLAIIGERGDAILTPVYDPAPMRAFARHDFTLALSMRGTLLSRPGRHMDLWQKMMEFGSEALNIRRDQMIDIFLDCRDASATYIENIEDHFQVLRNELQATQHNLRNIMTPLAEPRPKDELKAEIPTLKC